MTAPTTILTSFSGISDPGNYPPENALAVGPESIVTAESVPYEVTNLSGGAATTGSQFQLFSSLGPTLDNSVFDTRAAYDSSTGRFVLIANNLQPGGTATNIDIAISKDSNPADGWFVGSIDTSNGGTTQSDMPCLSVSGGNICITAPEFSGSPLVGSSEWVVSESSIASGSPQILASATTPAADAIMRNVSANGVTYYVSAQSNASQTQLTYQTYSAASGFSAPQTLMLGNSDKGPIGGDYAAQQAGTSLTLDAGDARIESLAYANGYLYGVSETLPTGASAPEIHWFKLDVSNPASPQLVIQGDLSGSLLGDPNIALFNASIAVDGRGDVLINFTASGPNMDPSDYYVVQGAQDSSFGTPTLYQASTSYFEQTPGATGMQRWGTYSSAVADPASQDGFWISNEYVTSTGVTIPSGLSAWWDTVVTNVQVAPYVPILGGAGTKATFTQGGAAAPLDPALTVKDVGSATLAGATIAISGGLLAGDALNFSNQAGIVGSYNAATGVLTLSGTASLAAYQTALESITYSSGSADASGAGADPSRTITWTVTDGAQTSTPITTSVDIAAASSVAASFSGISDPTNYPPQNALAVGPQSIVTAESSRYEVTNLAGGAATTGSLFSLFSSLGTTLDNSTYDPRAAYDSSTGRFVLIVNNIQPGGSTNIDIAVSNDSNPTDGWSVASLDTSTGGTTQSDMPDLSVTGGNIYLTAPEYPASGFSGTGQWVISESSVVSGSPQVIASQTAPPSDAIMRNISGGNGLTYYVSAFSNGSQSELTYETYSAAAGFSGTQTLALGNNDQGPGGTDYTAQQAGTSLTLDAGDSHIQSLAYANGYLYGVSETMPVGASAPDVHWFKLDASNPASPQIVAQGDLSGSLLGNANIALFNPSVAVDGNGDVLINFTASGPNMDPSDYYVVQGAKDLAFGAPTLYQASTSYFQQTPGATGAQRWGTYSSAVADPNNPNGFWISNEYVTNTGVTIPSGLSAWWDTAVAQVSVGGSVGGGPVGPPTIAGTHPTPTTVDAAVNPFTGVTIGDLNTGATDTLMITLSNSGTTGVLSGTGLSGGTNGVYTLSGTAAAVTSALDLLSFKPATGAPGSITTTTFALSDQSTGFATPATDSATTVTDTDAVIPTIAGTHPTPTTVDAAVNPFTGVTIGDLNAGATDTLTITLSNSGTTGVLSGPGLSGGTNGVYTLTKNVATTVTSQLDALTFTPAKGAPGSVTTTTFALSDQSTGFATPATDSATTVTDTDPALLTQPTISSATYTGAALTGHWSLSGTAPAGTTVTLYDGTTALAPTATATAGTWTIATTENESAIRDYTVIATSAGATSLPSAPYYEGTPGNDVFDFASEATVSAAALINGNGGASDTLQLTAASTLTDADFAYIKSVEILGLTGASRVTLGPNASLAGIKSVTTGTGNTTIADSNSGTLTINAAALGAGNTLTLAGSTAVTVTGLTGNLDATGDTGTLAVTATGAAVQVATGTGLTTITDSTSGSTVTVDATKYGIQTLTLAGNSGAKIVNNLAGNVTVTGNGALTVNAAGTGAQTVITGTGNTSITDTGSGSMTVNANASGAAQTLTLSGSANETVTNLGEKLVATGLTGNLTVTTNANALSIALGSGANTINAGAMTGTLTLTGASAAIVTALGGSLNATGDSGTLTVTTTGAAQTVTTGSGNIAITDNSTGTLTVNGAGSATVTTGSGATSIAGSATGGITVNATALGTNTLTLSGSSTKTVKNFAGTLVATGGITVNAVSPGSQSVTTTGTGAPTINDASGILTIDASKSTTGTLTLNGGATTTVNNLKSYLNATGDSGTLTVTTNGAAQTVTTGSGNITITDNSTGTLTVNGAALAAGSTLTLMGAGPATVTNLKSNLVATGDSGPITVTATGATAQTVTTGSGNISIADSTGTDTVNAAALSAGNTLTLSGSKAKTVNSLQGNLLVSSGNGSTTVTATGSGPQSITMGNGADTIIAETTGGDTIHGGGGADNINVTGHTAADTFTYSATTDSLNTTAGHDTITGFSGSDLLDFSSLNPSLKVGGLEAAGSQIAADSIAWVNLGASGMGVYVNDTTNALATTNTSLMETTLAGVSSLSASNFHA
jgi:hypothetical protein